MTTASTPSTKVSTSLGSRSMKQNCFCEFSRSLVCVDKIYSELRNFELNQKGGLLVKDDLKTARKTAMKPIWRRQELGSTI